MVALLHRARRQLVRTASAPGRSLALALPCLGVLALAVGLSLRVSGAIPSALLLLLGALLAGSVLALLAVTRFWWMVLVLFVVRTTLDAFKSDDLARGRLEPGTAVGAVFLVSGLLWLLAQWRAGDWTPVSRTAKALLALSAVAIVSSLGSELPVESLQSASRLLSVAVMLVVLEQIFSRRPERIWMLLAAMFGSFALPAIVSLAQLPNLRPEEGYNTVDVGRLQSTFVHPSSFAAYLGIMLVLAVALEPHVSRTWRWACIAVAGVSVPLLLLTYARGPWVAVYLALLFVGLAQARWLVVALLSAAVIVGLTIPSVSTRLSDLSRDERPQAEEEAEPNSFRWRLDYWGQALPLAAESPIVGIGFDMVQFELPARLPPHSAFIQTLVEAGVLGLGAFVAVLAAAWSDLRRAARRMRAGFGRGMAVGTAAASVSIVIELSSENLLTQPAVLWYLAAPLAWVFAVGRVRITDDAEAEMVAALSLPAG